MGKYADLKGTTNASFRVGGTVSAGDVLTADAAGVGAWAEPAVTALEAEGKKSKHGWNTQTLNSATQLTIAKPSTNWIFTLNCGANFEYYVDGVEVIIIGTKTYDFGTTPTQTLHYLFFDDATGTIKHRDTVWNLYTEVPIAACFFNGTTWTIQEERHFAIRDRSWHVWAHTTVGARYGSGFDLTAPNIGQNTTVNISGGTLFDEDITTNTSAATAVRIWFKTGATTWSFVDPATTPYDTTMKYTNASYQQVDVSSAKYINQWYYATADTTQKIWVVREFVAQDYNTAALARAVAPPNLNGSTYAFAGNSEMKLLYRIIWKGDDTVQEVTDYRLSSPVAGGGSAATSAAAVSYTPTSPETFVTVQGALDNRIAYVGPRTQDLAMGGTYTVSGLPAPDASGEAIRATTKITEAALESAVDLKHAAVTVSTPIALSGQAISLVNNAVSPGTIISIDVGTLATTSDLSIPTSKAVATYAAPIASPTLTGKVGVGNAAVTEVVEATGAVASTWYSGDWGQGSPRTMIDFAGTESRLVACPGVAGVAYPLNFYTSSINRLSISPAGVLTASAYGTGIAVFNSSGVIQYIPGLEGAVYAGSVTGFQFTGGGKTLVVDSDFTTSTADANAMVWAIVFGG